MRLHDVPSAAIFVICFVLVSAYFPNRSLGNGSMGKEKTLAIVKPDGFAGNYTDDIKKIIIEAGFEINKEKITQLDEETVSAFYAEHLSKSFFSDLVQYMKSGPVLVMILEKENAVADWRALIGPTDAGKARVSHPQSIRAMCGLDSQKNCIHGSDSSISAQREISFFFKDMIPGEADVKHDEL